jgi:protein-tyrosine phosphatase
VFRHKVAQAGWARQVIVDSAGTHSYLAGAPPDARSQQHAARRGYDLADLRARRIEAPDFEQADLLLVMDWDNFALTRALCPPAHLHKVRRLTEFCQRMDSPVVPDPYSGGASDFERVLDLVEDACNGLLAHLEAQMEARGARKADGPPGRGG